MTSGLIPPIPPDTPTSATMLAVALHAHGGNVQGAGTTAGLPIIGNSVRTVSRNGSTATNRGRKQIEIPDAAD
ncbi:hypothetical protein LGM65_09820 [Burkholderia anthina]|nr:hypothetical protein [Burkholderia anthina]